MQVKYLVKSGQAIMNNLTYIVTGATGHLGSHIVQKLVMNDCRVRVLVLPNETCYKFIKKSNNNLHEYVGNICDKASLERIFSEDVPNEIIVIHCAGLISITKKEEHRLFDINVGGTSNIIKMCKQYPVKRLVYISSIHAIPSLPYGQIIKEIDNFNPDKVTGYYDKSKAIATQLVIDAGKAGLDTVILHPSGIIGPNGSVTGNMSYLINRFINGKLPFAIRGAHDFVDVRDVADGVISAATKGKRGECYILSNRLIGFDELFDTLSEICGNKKKLLFLPLWVAKAIAPLAELYYWISHKTPLVTIYSLRKLSECNTYSCTKAEADLNYRTRPLQNTLKDTIIGIKP